MTPDTLLKPSDVHDREREWASLGASIEGDAPSLVFVLGRRRAGKSYLLTRFVTAARGLYYQATRKTEREQLRDLSRALGERFDDAALRRVDLPDWDAVFGYVADRAAGSRFVLVLDEFPYLVDSAPALPSVLQRWWDHDLSDTRITIILSGSHITAMKRLEGADQPLFGRRTARIDVRPFDYFDAASFVPDWAARDKLLLYAVFGGLPGHLALIDPRQSLAENAARHLVSSSGRLFDEAGHAFDAFVADAAVHYSIVDAIASGEHKWNKISNRVGKQTSALSRPLEWLMEMEVVERVAPLAEYPNPNPRRTLYRVADPYLLFWHRFVSDIRARGLANLIAPELLWERIVLPSLDDHAGQIFEEACRQFMARAPHPILPFRPVEVGSWWNDDSSSQVDVVAFDGLGGLLVGECKWGPVDEHDLSLLRHRGRLVATELASRGVPVEQTTHALFSGEEEEATARVEGDVAYVPIKALYEVSASA